MHVFDRKIISLKRNRPQKNNQKNPYFLQDWAMNDMEQRLSFIKKEFPNILQIGARGKNLKNIVKGNQDYIISDVANNVIKTDIVFDEEFLPFKDNHFDCVLSSLNLHAVNDLPGCLLQIKRCLKADGLFLAAMFGGETLFELRDCFTQAEIEISGGITPRIFPFADKQQMGGLLQRAGYALPVVDSEVITVTYETPFHLMHDLRAMGETNIIAARSKKFTPKTLFHRAFELYAQKYSEPDGRIRASFEIIFIMGWSPHESQQKPLQRGSAQSRLSDALNTIEIGTGEKPQ